MRKIPGRLESVLSRFPSGFLAVSVFVLAIVGSYFTVGVLVSSRVSSASPARETANDSPPINPFAEAHGSNLIAFVIAASDCGWSTRPQTMAALGGLRSKLRSVHADVYAQISVVGVALDRNPATGVEFLSKVAAGSIDRAFDQIIAGGSWLNEQIVRFVWREGITEASTPQVIVIERYVDTASYLRDYSIGTEPDRVVANRRGSAEIIQWFNENVPFDAPLVSG